MRPIPIQRVIAFAWLSLIGSQPLHASLINLLSANRSVSVSGYAGYSTYSNSQSSAELGSFDVKVAGSVSTAPVPPDFQGNHSEGYSYQKSVLGPNSFSISQRLDAQSWGSYPFYIGARAYSEAASSVEITFSVTETAAYDLSPFQYNHADVQRDTFFLSAGGVIEQRFHQYDFKPFTGILSPGKIYTLTESQFVSTGRMGEDYLGRWEMAETSFTMHIVPAPDGGWSITCLTLALLPLTGCKTRLLRKRSVLSR